MISLLFAARGLASTPARNLYLIMTLFLAAASWLILGTLAAPFLPLGQSGGTAHVTAYVSSANRGQVLPLRHARRIAKMDGVAGTVHSSIVLVKCRDDRPAVSIQVFGGSRETLLALADLWPAGSPELEAMQEAWLDDPRGVLLGSRHAEDCQWQAGQGVAPKTAFTDQPVEFIISAVRPAQESPIMNMISFGHYDYFNRAGALHSDRDTFEELTVLPASPRRIHELVAQIEQSFAHDDPPIETGTGAQRQNALERYGQAQYVLGGVMLSMLLCTLLVMTSVLAHSVAERRVDMALLLVLGFSRTTVWRSFVLEVLTMVIIGTCLGVAGALLLMSSLPETVGLFFNGFRAPHWAWRGLPALAAFITAVALVVPTLTIARLHTTDLRAL